VLFLFHDFNYFRHLINVINFHSFRRLLLQTSVILKKDETIQTITEKVQYLEEFREKLPSENIKEDLMMMRVSVKL
jgi:hypothetical protein